MTARIREFLKQRTNDGPCLVVDLDVVRENYQNFAKALPDSRVFSPGSAAASTSLR
jgi:ornithine decarboxylase